MKQTSLSSYSTYAWEGATSGWSTVYQFGDIGFGNIGWETIYFTTPFQYDGVHNLMVDFSFNSSYPSSDGFVNYSNTGAPVPSTTARTVVTATR